MAITLRRWQRFEVTDDQGNTYVGGNAPTAKPKTISLSSETFLDLRKSLSLSTVWDAWEAGAEEPLSDFDYLFCETDLDDTYIELTTDKGGENGTVVYTIPVNKDFPFELCADDSFANYTANWATGTTQKDLIDRIRIRNNSTATAANIRLFLAS